MTTSQTTSLTSETIVKPKLVQPGGPNARRVYWMNCIQTELEDGTPVKLQPMPEQIAVALAKCSRSNTPFDQNVYDVSLEQAASFHEKWVVGYGHGSVAEHAVASVAFQNIPQVVVKALEDCRLASYTEKSSRYQVFTRERVDVPATLAASSYMPRASALFDRLYELYNALLQPLTALIEQRHPKPDDQTDAMYRASTKARVCDVARYLLPAASLTAVGMTANGRVWERVIVKLLSSHDILIRQVGLELRNVLRGEAGMDVEHALRERPLSTLLKYANASPYLAETPITLKKLAHELPAGHATTSRQATAERTVVMTSDDRDAELHIAAALISRYGNLSFSAALDRLLGEENAIERVLRTALGDRGPHDAPLREFEHAYFQHEIVMDYGAWRDIQRHRMCTQSNQTLGVDLGYDIPAEIAELGRADEFRRAMDEAADLCRSLKTNGLEIEAEYVIPMAYRRRLIVSWNLRELFHFIELRSGRKGHPSYRRIAQELWRTLEETHPMLAAYIRVDFSTDNLSTLGAKPRGI